MTFYDIQDDMSEDMPFDVAASRSRPSLSATTTKPGRTVQAGIRAKANIETEEVSYPMHSLTEYTRIGGPKNAGFVITPSLNRPLPSPRIHREIGDTKFHVTSPPRTHRSYLSTPQTPNTISLSQDEEESEETYRYIPNVYKGQSSMQFIRRDQPQSHDFPDTPSRNQPSPIARSSPRYINQETRDNRGYMISPPRIKYSQKPPQTPDTVSSSRDEEDIGAIYDPDLSKQRELAWESILPNVFKDEGHGENSSSTSATVLHENAARIPEKTESKPPEEQESKLPEKQLPRESKKPVSLATKSAIGAMICVIILGIVMVTASFFIFKEDDESTEPAASDPNVFSWPTSRPTFSNQWPTSGDTPSPSFSPTSTSKPTTTASPTSDFYNVIADFLFEEDSQAPITDAAMEKALEWLVNEAEAAQSLLIPYGRLDHMQKYRQRYGVLILYFSLNGNANDDTGLPSLEMQNQDECTWSGVICDANGVVTEIKLPSRQLDGTMPAEWQFLPNLKSIDLSKNKLQGSIPEGLYDIVGLEELYLYKNQLTGTISSKIGNLWDLRWFVAANNRLSGSIPPELASAANRVRRLRYFNVYRNQMTGTIPSTMRLRQLYYLDLGRNKFEGNLPPSLGTDSVRLRHLHLDHNEFSGSFPWEVLNAGDGRLKVLTLENNQLSSSFPGNHLSNYTLVELTIQNNNFVSMERDTCELDVFSGGNLIEFKSNCLVCRCGVALMCKHCVL